MNTSYLNYTLILFLAGIVSSCKVGEAYKRPDAVTDGLYRSLNSADTTSVAALPWNQVFTDPALQALITEGIAKNINLQVAYTRVRASQSYLLQSKTALFPSLDANAQVAAARLSNAQTQGRVITATQYQLGLSSSWEADIWGRLGSSKRAAMASLLQNQAYAKAVQTGLVAGIATYYYNLLSLDKQLAITEQTVQNRVKTVETMRALKEAAVVTGAAVVQSEASRYAAEVTIPDLKQSIRETENALSLLLGRVPGSISRTSIDDQKGPGILSAGVPAQLLSNRPDVIQAEANYRYFLEQTNIARASFYPALTINASGGLTSFALNTFFNSGSLVGSVAGGLTQPIFNRRQNKTRLEVAREQQQEALLGFQNSLLMAGQEVSDAISLYQTSADKMAVRINQIGSLQKSVEFTQELLRYGSSNYTEVLNAQQSLLSAQLSSVNDKLQQLRAGIDLYRSVGGGWR